MKACTVCKQEKPETAFPFAKNSRVAARCKACTAEYNKLYRLRNRDKLLSYDKARRATEAYRQMMQGHLQVYKENNPVKVSARRELNKAVNRGDIQKLPCQVCGNKRSHAHHPAYSLPLDVVWLCAVHHRECHK